jgi:hypothetical protein
MPRLCEKPAINLASGFVWPAPRVRLSLVRLREGSYAAMDDRREVGRILYIPDEERWWWVLRWTEITGYAGSRSAALADLARSWSEHGRR